jgi:hypothetical protein
LLILVKETSICRHTASYTIVRFTKVWCMSNFAQVGIQYMFKNIYIYIHTHTYVSVCACMCVLYILYIHVLYIWYTIHIAINTCIQIYTNACLILMLYRLCLHVEHIQGGSNMTGTNCDLFTHIVPVIFEPPCITNYKPTICTNLFIKRLRCILAYMSGHLPGAQPVLLTYLTYAYGWCTISCVKVSSINKMIMIAKMLL